MNYHRPTSFEDAAAIAARAGGVTRFLAGGTDVLVQLRSDVVTPDDVVDLKRIAGADAIRREADGGWRIGAAASGLWQYRYENQPLTIDAPARS